MGFMSIRKSKGVLAHYGFIGRQLAIDIYFH